MTIDTHIANPRKKFPAPASPSAVTHDSGSVFSLGAALIEHIERSLERTLREDIGWHYMFHAFKRQAKPADELHHVFALHSRYIRLNMERQRELITDVEVASRSFIISELSVIESQKQTIERLMGTYAAAVFAQQSELANFKANSLAIVGVAVAITAFVITDLRFQALLK